jgi:hypothetical protein
LQQRQQIPPASLVQKAGRRNALTSGPTLTGSYILRNFTGIGRKKTLIENK